MRRTIKNRAGFTLMELMVSLLIIGMLLSLLIVGMLHARRYVQSVTDRQTVDSVFQGATEFQQRFGFPVPLVREQAPTQPRAVEDRPAGMAEPGVRRRYAVYNPYDSAAGPTYEGLLRHEPPAAPNRPFSDPSNPFVDYRYSERSLAFYLVGAVNEPYAAWASAIPIDGVAGPGFYKPAKDGSYDVPRDVVSASNDPASRLRAGQKFDALVAFTGNAPKLFTDPTPPSNRDDRVVELQDRKGMAIRYYRWLPAPTASGTQTADVLRDLRVPPLVGRLAVDLSRNPPSISTPDDRDLEKNPELKSAAWAIVAAGPDGAFGDEPLTELARRLGIAAIAPADALKYRQQAEKDNIVRVGK